MGSTILEQDCFKDVLDKIRKESKSTTDLGTKFERMMKDFFTSDKHYKDRFKDVKLWSEYEGKDGHDTGIDLVATEWNGDQCAIQCKCYADDGHLDMNKVATFLASATKYKNKILVYTGESITDNAERVLKKNNCKKIRPEDLEGSSIDWCNYPRLVVKKSFRLHNYQEDAIAKTLSGFTDNDRGKLIMACGTGKTLVSMHIAENMVGKGGIVLYLVPSISLIQQSMRSWSNNANIPHRYMAVCSDTTVSEGGSITELESPATTDPYELKPYINSKKNDAMTVIFSTYHSIDVVRKALVGKSIDLVICDEAHRTTGMEGRSFYTIIHEDKNIHAKKRLYMTATPRVYSDQIKINSEKQIYSMDDDKYGQEFYKLTFADAVHKYNALSDFKVKIAIVPEELISAEYQKAIGGNTMLPLTESARMAAMWHGIQYPDDDETKNNLLQRVITFFNRIDKSEMFAGERLDPKGKDRSFDLIVKQYNKIKHVKNTVKVMHIDGRDNAHIRKTRMNWLAESNLDPNNCRVLSNARCLSEGVDVPALDGIVFADPRQSVVDVVQSVGRVMRKFPKKKYGYVILPVAIPAGISPHDVFAKNGPFKVVWQVLNGLRSHDEDFAREINQLILDKTSIDPKKPTPRISISVLDQYWEDDETLSVLMHDMKTKLVKHVGDMHYYEKYGAHLGKVAVIVEEKINKEVDSSNSKRKELELFHKNLQNLINESVTKKEAIRIIAQHIILSQVFDELFAGKFTTYNPISTILNNMVSKFGMNGELEELQNAGFYDEVRAEVKEIKKHGMAESYKARQNFIKTIYGNFFKSTIKKDTEQHGVVYTPVEIIDFIINSVEYILYKEFGTGFNDRTVKVLDPFTGTGTFLSRLLESSLITSNLYEKYKHDLYANEVILLAYYIATINIETVYSNLRPSGKYVPFDGINYTDTLRLNAKYRKDSTYRHQAGTFDEDFRKVHERIYKQRWSHIHVIMGNPPYSAGQSNFNDENPNIRYDEVDKNIKSTYVQKTKVTNVNSLYDSYIRSLRWASDRMGESGIIAFVTNASFIKTDTTAGIRACLNEEFTDIWCFDLRGNQRTQGKVSRQEGGKIFDSSSRTPIAITILVKNPKKKLHKIHYKDIGNYLTREQKLELIKNAKSIQGVDNWQHIQPDKYHDWIEQRESSFNKYTPIGSKEAKSGIGMPTIFKKYSGGVKTNRDPWAYNSSKTELAKNMKNHINYCLKQKLDKPIFDPKQAKWTGSLTERLKKQSLKFDIDKIQLSLYRPFFKQYLYFDRTFNDAIYQIPKFFPNEKSENLIICIPYKFIGEFSTLITNVIPDLQIVRNGQYFALYTYVDDKKQENVTDFILQEYREYYKDITIKKMDIFYYVYGLLHHQKYKKKFASNLGKELPNIPMAPKFWQFRDAGKKLAELHLNYENGKRYRLGKPLVKFDKFKNIRFPRTKIDGKSSNDTTRILIDGVLVFENIPQTNYRVNGRTPLEWIVERYKITIDKESRIINDPTDIDIVALIERIVYVGLESDKIISTLPDEFEAKGWKPKAVGLDAHIPSTNFQSSL